MEKLNVNRCMQEDPNDSAGWHSWSSSPALELTDLGPVAWWVCGRCLGRVLHDPDTEDGFPEEPIVVYPPSCFDDQMPDGPWCGCPHKASGDVVHLEGCVDDAVQLESAALMAERLGTPFQSGYYHNHRDSCGAPGCVSWGRRAGEMIVVPEPLPIAHPPTDPAPPTEELAQAMAEADEEEPPTLRRCPACAGKRRFEQSDGDPSKYDHDAGPFVQWTWCGLIEPPNDGFVPVTYVPWNSPPAGIWKA